MDTRSKHSSPYPHIRFSSFDSIPFHSQHARKENGRTSRRCPTMPMFHIINIQTPRLPKVPWKCPKLRKTRVTHADARISKQRTRSKNDIPPTISIIGSVGHFAHAMPCSCQYPCQCPYPNTKHPNKKEKQSLKLPPNQPPYMYRV